jgi:hypothetical protein
MADRNLKRLTSGRARAQHLCWDVIKRLRPSPGNLYRLFLVLRLTCVLSSLVRVTSQFKLFER